MRIIAIGKNSFVCRNRTTGSTTESKVNVTKWFESEISCGGCREIRMVKAEKVTRTKRNK